MIINNNQMGFRILLLIIFSVFAINTEGQKPGKKIIITGNVVDANDSPVQGASLMVDGKYSKISTDDKGFYKIRVKTSSEKLGVFTLSSGLKEAKIEGETNINFILDKYIRQQPEKSNNSDQEEEVNTGYSSIKRKNLAEQVNKLDPSDSDYNSYTSIYEMIKGRLPGVEVSGKSIRIQGANSFNGSTEPLFVVDGFAVPSIDYINPQEVKSIEILKGASASVFGSRGANGVILITLKGAFGVK